MLSYTETYLFLVVVSLDSNLVVTVSILVSAETAWLSGIMQQAES